MHTSTTSKHKQRDGVNEHLLPRPMSMLPGQVQKNKQSSQDLITTPETKVQRAFSLSLFNQLLQTIFSVFFLFLSVYWWSSCFYFLVVNVYLLSLMQHNDWINLNVLWYVGASSSRHMQSLLPMYSNCSKLALFGTWRSTQQLFLSSGGCLNVFKYDHMSS